mmetsp:Transcript_20321/g.81193  ORF Transcript_20321/g.81193 Transcript_20321/m.81193 type:complete len:260 (-) Transcript_20321:908-1687(-)
MARVLCTQPHTCLFVCLFVSETTAPSQALYATTTNNRVDGARSERGLKPAPQGPSVDLRGAKPSLIIISSNSVRLIEPLPSVSNSWNMASILSMSTFWAARRSMTDGRPNLGSGVTPTSTSICSARYRPSRQPTLWMKSSVVKPASFPAMSHVPWPYRNVLWSALRSAPTYASYAATAEPPLRAAACEMAPMSASAMPSGLNEVGSPRRCACHRSATVPCDASNSLMGTPSAVLPTRFDVMNPGDRCTWATSSVNMSPS